MAFTNEDTLALMATLFETIQNEIHPEVSAARLAALTAVMRSPGLQQSDLAGKVVKLAQQGTSRAVMSLQGKTRSNDAYPVLIQSMPDPAFSRRNILAPTPIAGQLLNKLTEALNKAAAAQKAGSAV